MKGYFSGKVKPSTEICKLILNISVRKLNKFFFDNSLLNSNLKNTSVKNYLDQVGHVFSKGELMGYNFCLCPGVYPVPQRTRLGPTGTQNNKGGLKLHFLYTRKLSKETNTLH